ncbi:MAG: D-alanyl-D-alanine carboxypeptidase/D-alanyl-D-alanine-endopeptidase [Acidimicrobiales bacterium]
MSAALPSPRRRRRAHRLAAALLAVAVAAAPAVAQAQAPTGGSTPPGSAAPKRATTPVLSSRRVPDLVRTRTADAEVAKAAAAYQKEAGPGSCLVVSDHGRVITKTNGQQPVIPASVLKTFTGTAALDVLGPETTLSTVASTATPAGPDGVVAGDLYLVGGGDPLLFTEGFRTVLEDKNQPQTDFAVLADRIKAAGVTEVRGNIVGDESRYDAQRSVDGWEPSYQRDDQVGALSALEVNRGNSGLSDNPDVVARSRKLGDPAPLAAATLKSLLVKRGVKVTGTGVAGTAPAGATEVARLESLPVRELVGEMLTWSDNTTAELLTKEIGRAVSGQGTTAAGVAAVRSTLEAKGIPMAQITTFDGSGLHRGNRITCDAAMAVLQGAGPSSALAAGFAVAGEKGTLRKRMKGTPAAGKVVAKTGSLKDVYSLAGWANTLPGSQLTFVALINGQPKDGVKVLDDLAVALTAFPQGAAGRDVVGPRPPT